MKHRIAFILGLFSLQLFTGLNMAADARGGGGHGGGHSGGMSGARGFTAPPAPKMATGFHNSGRRFGRRGGGRRGGYGGYYDDQPAAEGPVTNGTFESSHFSGPDHITPETYGHFVKNYNWPSK